MAGSNKKNITRRSFLLGGSAAIISSAAVLNSCNNKKEGAEGSSHVDITAAVEHQCSSFSPIASINPLAISANWHVCESLYNMDYYTFKTYNGLAALSPEKLTDKSYRVVLRDEACFSNGNPVTPDDVINAFDRSMGSKNFISPLLTFIKDVKKDPDDKNNKSIIFDLNFPFESLLEERLSIVPIFPKDMSDSELDSMPVGSGPWKYNSINGSNGGKIEFIVNEHYNGKFSSSSKNMIWNIVPDADNRAQSIINKSVLVAESISEKDSDDVKEAGVSVDFVQGCSCPVLCFNTLKKPFDDYRVRQAIHYCIDVEKIINTHLGNVASFASSLLPKNHQNYHRASFEYEKNTEKAKSLLKEAGHENLNINILCNSDWTKEIIPDIQQNLVEAGINCTYSVENINWNQIKETNGNNNFDCILSLSDPSLYGNDADLIMSYWYGDSIWMDNITSWKKSNPEKYNELHDLLEKARQISSLSTQQNIWNSCLNIISEHCPIYPLLHRQICTAYASDKLTNFRTISTTGLLFLGVSAKE